MIFLSKINEKAYVGSGPISNGTTLPTQYANRKYKDIDTGVEYVDTIGDGTGWNRVTDTLDRAVRPILSCPVSGNENTDVNVQISNYDPSYTYTVSVTTGTVVQNGLNITWSLPEVQSDTNASMSCFAAAAGTLQSVEVRYDLLIKNVPYVEDQTLVYDSTNIQDEFTKDLLNADVTSVVKNAKSTDNILDTTKTSTVHDIYINNSLASLKPGDVLKSGSELFTVSVVNNDGTVASIADVKTIACGVYHTVAIKDDDSEWSVGRNNYGQLGDGSTTNRSSFVSTGISAKSAKSVVQGSGQYLNYWVNPTQDLEAVPTEVIPLTVLKVNDVQAVPTSFTFSDSILTQGFTDIDITDTNTLETTVNVPDSVQFKSFTAVLNN